MYLRIESQKHLDSLSAEELSKLAIIDISDTDVSDISAFVSCKQLRELWMSVKNVSDISALANCIDLRYIINV